MKKIILLTLTFILKISFANAAEKLTNNIAGPFPFAMSISGGVSLGSYQAGFLYHETQFLRANREKFRPWIITGSSAGAINALIAVIEYCDYKDRALEDSLFWQTWTTMGFNQLAPEAQEGRSPTALFSRKSLIDTANNIERRWKMGLPESCDMAVGITATLLNPETIKLSDGISIQRQTMRFILRIRGQGENRVPVIENYVDTDPSSLQPKLYFDSLPENRFPQLRNLLLASSAFPAAFDPVELRFCRSETKPVCDLANSEEQSFVDGGILENQPLRLALRIAKQSLKLSDKKRVGLADQPRLATAKEDNSVLQSLVVLHVDTDARGYPSLATELSQKDEKRFIAYLAKFGMDLVSTARTRELYSLLEETPNIRDRISPFPRASDPWVAFMGFFDRGFREFDFLLGASDARRSIESFNRMEVIKPQLLAHSDNIQNKIACVRAYSDPKGLVATQIPTFCQEADMKNIRALSQTMWNRLSEACLQETPTPHERKVYYSCRSPWKSGTPEWISADFAKLPWKRRSPEVNEGIHMLESLQRYGYHFDPEEFKADRSPIAQISTKIRKQVRLLEKRQPVEDRNAISAIGETLANQLYYESPDRFLIFTLGETAEIGLLTKNLGIVSLPDDWRVGILSQSARSFDIFKRDQGGFNGALMLAAEKDISNYKSRSVVLKIGLRGGTFYSAVDRWGKETCQNVSSEFVGACSGWTFQPSLVVTFLERLRFQVVERIVFTKEVPKPATEPSMQLGFQIAF